MSELSKKYNVPESAIKAMIKDGWISCSVPQYEEIYYYYKEARKGSNSDLEARTKTSEKFNVSESWVYKIVHKF